MWYTIGGNVQSLSVNKLIFERTSKWMSFDFLYFLNILKSCRSKIKRLYPTFLGPKCPIHHKKLEHSNTSVKNPLVTMSTQFKISNV